MLTFTKNKSTENQDKPKLIPLKQIKTFNYLMHNRIVLSSNSCHYVISFQDIAHIKSIGNYCQFHLMDGRRITVSKTLKHYEQLLNENFKRVHQSSIVNLLLIKTFDFKSSTITLVNDETISVSRSRKNGLVKLISQSFLFKS